MARGKTRPTRDVKAGRDAKTGRFIPIEEAERRKATAVVETIRKGKNR